MRRIAMASATLALALAVGGGPGAGTTAYAQPSLQNPLAPAARPETAPPLPHASSDPSGAWVGDVLYVHSGEQPPASRDAAGTGQAALYALSPGDASWSTVWTGAPARGAALVSDGEDLYRVGGAEIAGARRARRNLERWDGTGGRWVDLTPMPSGRTDHAAVVVGRELWVIGGWTPSAVVEAPGTRRGRPAVPAEDWREDVLVADLDRDPRGLDRGRDGCPAPAFARRGRTRRCHLDRRGHQSLGGGCSRCIGWTCGPGLWRRHPAHRRPRAAGASAWASPRPAATCT